MLRAMKKKKLRDSEHYNRVRKRLNERMGNKKKKSIIKLSEDIDKGDYITKDNTYESINDNSSTNDIPDDLSLSTSPPDNLV